jgi:uncharacterized membrane protein YqjE
MIKIILQQTVDLLLGLVALILLIWWMIDNTQNFSWFLGFTVMYIIFNVINKAIMIKNNKL